MCGIAGFIDPRVPPHLRAEAAERMAAAMQHRGPDDSGRETIGCATLVMRRLAVFDPAHGHQPLRTRDGRFTLIFNGAIYNFRELRTELTTLGCEFSSACDTEVLLAAYQQWGSSCLSRLRGMFAFAVWDEIEQILFLARDPFGIKPLYYRHDGARFLFASELNALAAARQFSAEIDPVSVSDYLGWLSVPAPRTIYRDVFSLRPGESATFCDGELALRRTWTFDAIPRPPEICLTRAEFVHQLRVQLDQTLRAHMLADVPVGAFLSGGLDSALVAGLMTRAAPGKLRTFSIGFEESDYSESAHAEETARHIGATHHTRILSGREVAKDLETIIAAFDQPTGDGINTYYASQTARAGGVTVALSGLGGDELFGGYPLFRSTPKLMRWLPCWRALPDFSRALILHSLRRGDTRSRKLADFLQHAATRQEVASLQRSVFPSLARAQLLHADHRSAVSDRTPFHPELDSLRSELAQANDFATVSAWELRTYMSDVLLRESDTMSMRHSLELRVPFVDRPLIEWLWHQPADFKFDPRHPKSILQSAAYDVLPPGLATRKKRGFTFPLNVWMRRGLRPFLDETFSLASISRSGLFDPAAVASQWKNFLQHDDSREWSRVWSLAMLIAFVNRPTPLSPT